VTYQRDTAALYRFKATPDHRSLVSVELKSVGSHPPANVAYACSQKHGSGAGNSHQLTEAVNLSVVGVEVPMRTTARCRPKHDKYKAMFYGVDFSKLKS